MIIIANTPKVHLDQTNSNTDNLFFTENMIEWEVLILETLQCITTMTDIMDILIDMVININLIIIINFFSNIYQSKLQNYKYKESYRGTLM